MNNVFTVYCNRIGRSHTYLVKYPVNDYLTNKIKEYPKEERKWNVLESGWEISVYYLYKLLLSFKGSTKIFFDFGGDENKQVFVTLIKKAIDEAEEKRLKVEELEKNKLEWIAYKNTLETTYEQQSKYAHSFLKEGVKLYPHQIVAGLYLSKVKNALISHEMGLGKTLSSILYVETNHFDKVIVITPNSLKFNFYYEVDKFTNSKAHIINWNKNKYTIEESKYIIFNYDFFRSTPVKKKVTKKNGIQVYPKWDKLKISNIDCVICDESTRLKSIDSQTYINYNKIFTSDIFKNGNVSKVYLSGTPAPNRAFELYTVLNQISPIDFPTKTYFYEYYCGMTYNKDGFGYDTNIDDQKFEELYFKLSPYTHRKRKFEVLKDLPDKIYQKLMVEMDSAEYKIYTEIEKGVANEFISTQNASAITKMVRLRQYTSSLKIKPLLDIIDDILETGQKIVIIDFFKDSLYKLKEKLGDIAGLHTGDQTVEERAELVKDFQNPSGNIKIFLGSIQTCNYGLTLTASSKMFLLTQPYSVGEYDQVADRCHRIGSKDTVNIYPVIFRDTIDEYVFNAIEYKRKEINKVIDNEDYESDVEESIIGEVIKHIKEKYGK